MDKLAVTALVALCAAACAPVTTPPVSAPTGALALHADEAVPARVNAAFAAEIAGRYLGDIGLETVVGDLTVNGFVCNARGSYPQVQPGGVLSVCELPKPHGLCSDMWTVDLKLKRVTRALSFHRVAAEGRFARSCVAGASPDG